MTSVARFCSVEGCDNPREKRTKCRECYEIDSWGRSPGKISDFSGAIQEDERCVVPECSSPKMKRNPLCSNHKTVARRYTMSLQDFIKHITGECAICGSRENLCVDHDHACCPGIFGCGDCNRGTLCRACNQGLGSFRDNPDLLKEAAKYLAVSAMC